jgi:hypothetical protein
LAERQKILVQLIASAVGLALVVALVTALSYAFIPNDVLRTSLFGTLFAIPTALAAWTGVLWRDKGKLIKGPDTWAEWIVVFLSSSTLALIFLSIDIAVVHPGFSLIFTIGACSISVIALPSAVRAWLLRIFNATL